MYTQLNELNIYSFTILKIVSVRSGKKIPVGKEDTAYDDDPNE